MSDPARLHPAAGSLRPGRLLLATEHTAQDRGAERLAFALAREQAQPLMAVMPLASNPEYETVAPQVAAHAEADLAARRDALRADAAAAGAAVHLCVRRGSDPDAEIVAEARDRAAELLVIRRRGKRGLLANLLVGEMVSKVLAHAPCSVLVVPVEGQPWQRGVLACIDHEAVDAEVVRWAVRAAAPRSLPLHLVCVVARDSERASAEAALAVACRTAEAASAGTGVRIAAAVRVGPVHGRIGLATSELDADLIVMGRHGGHLLGRAWIGGVTQKVIGTAPCPVLVAVPAPDSAAMSSSSPVAAPAQAAPDPAPALPPSNTRR
ncbi:MAG: universal stress protein [Rubrivivax sp.]|nr:universal stress protein [Rubrivivax sp.]